MPVTPHRFLSTGCRGNKIASKPAANKGSSKKPVDEGEVNSSLSPKSRRSKKKLTGRKIEGGKLAID
jgi:hypothetical protein